MPAPPKKHISQEAAKDWMSDCISTRQHEHPDEDTDQSVAICANIYKKATGVEIKRGG